MSMELSNNFNSYISNFPHLALGTSRLHNQTCISVVAMAIEFGYRIIDTARSYRNEKEIYKGIKKAGIEREKLFLITKIHLDSMSYHDVMSSVEESLQSLQTNYIDLVMIHWPCSSVPLRETLSALDLLKSTKKILFYGVSNFPLAYLDYARSLTDSISAIQAEHHPFFKDSALFEYTSNNGIYFMSYRPTARGKAGEHPVIIDIAERYNVTPHQVILGWHMAQYNNIAICGASSDVHLKENIQSLKISLTTQDIQFINSIHNSGRTLYRDYAPDWNTKLIPPLWV